MFIEREFDSSSKLELPKETIKYSSDNYNVYIVPEKAQWCIIPKGVEDQIFISLQRGLRISEVFEILVKDFNCNNETAEKLIGNVIAEILDKNFFVDFYLDNSNLKYKELKLFLTNYCNLRCQHCYRYNANTKIQELTSKEWKSIIKQFAENGGETVLISGGEPLLRKKNLYQILKLSKEYDLKTAVLTNGTLLDSEFVRNVKSTLDEIQISLDGPTIEIADKIRGNGNFHSVLNAIKELNKIKIKIFIAMTPLPSNIYQYKLHLASLIRTINSLSTNEVIFRLTRNIEDGRNVSKLTSLQQIEFENQIFELEDEVFGKGYNHLLDSAFYDVGIKLTSCGIANSIGIQPNGDIFLCDLGKSSVCNVKEKSLSEIIDTLNKYSLKYSIDNLAECNKCSLKYLCGGPCRFEIKSSVYECSKEFKTSIIERLIKMNKYRYEQC